MSLPHLRSDLAMKHCARIGRGLWPGSYEAIARQLPPDRIAIRKGELQTFQSLILIEPTLIHQFLAVRQGLRLNFSQVAISIQEQQLMLRISDRG